MLAIILIPFIVSILFLVPGRRRQLSVWMTRSAVVLPLGLFLVLLWHGIDADAGRIGAGNDMLSFDWSVRLDGLGYMFAMLITGIGTLIFLYAGGYMKGKAGDTRLLGFLSLFMGAMLGVVMANNLIALFLFWELTSISSFFLIGFKNEDEASRESALKALSVTGGGGLIMLAGLIMLGEVAGTYQISEMIYEAGTIKEHTLFVPILILVFFGALTKSAQFPFHFWLPGAMKAPTPVSAYLHSATMVKAGVYLLARFNPILGDHPYWNYTLMLFGGVTMLYAAIHAVLRTDMKSILAYSTVSALGVMVFLIGMGSEKSILALSVFIVVHALYKASLFMTTGVVDYAAKSRDISKLSGLRKVMMPLAAAGLLAAVSNAGIPPSVGFIGKDLIYEGTLHAVEWAWPLTVLAVLTNIFLVVAGFMAGWKPFGGDLKPELELVKLPEWTMWTPPLLLAVLGIVFGLFPGLLDDGFTGAIYESVSGLPYDSYLALWHGFNTVFYLSMATLVGGLVLYVVNNPGGRISQLIKSLKVLSPEYILTGLARGFNGFARYWTQLFQNGFLRMYLLTILSFTIIFLGLKVFQANNSQFDFGSLTTVTFYEATTVLVLFIAIAFTVLSQSRLAAVAAMGVVGYAICIIFVFYSAPDLAMTQFTIDTLTVILFVLVLYKLPKFLKLEFKGYHIRDIGISLGFGALITILALEVLEVLPTREISEYYVNNSYSLAKGKNIVNVILVDFRGTDTLIEIVVLSIAAIGVFSLLKLRIKPDNKVE